MSKFCPINGSNCVYLNCQECGRDPQCKKFFCLVAGGRDFTDYEMLKSKLDYMLSRQGGRVVIVHGGARGADTLAEQYATEKGYDIVRFPADWKKHGRAAGPIRNRQMFEYIRRMEKAGALFFWDGKSPGTKNDIELAKEYGIRYRVVSYVETNKGSKER